MTNDETPSTPDKWAGRANNITVFWKALWPPACWTLAAVLTIGEAVAAFLGHTIDPQIVVLIGGLFGLPFFSTGRGAGTP